MTFEPGTYQTQELIDRGYLQIGDGYRAKNSELSSKGIPFARAGNINNGFLFDGVDRFPIPALDKVGEKRSRLFDSVITSKGTVGRIAYVKDGTPEFVYSPQLCYWRSLDFGIIEPRFLNYWMSGAEFRNQIDYLKGQTDMADYVSLRDQRRMTITIPDIEKQKWISSVLGSVDDKIDLNRQTNQTLEHIAQAIFKSWFVDFEPVKAKVMVREKGGSKQAQALAAQAIIAGTVTLEELKSMDAGYSGWEETLRPLVVKNVEPLGLASREPEHLAATAALFPSALTDSPLGPIPEGWGIGTLAEFADFQNGYAFKSKDWTESGLPVVKIGSVKPGIVDLSNCSYIAEDTVAGLDKFQLNAGDILVGMTGYPGETGVVPIFEVAPYLNQRVGKISPKVGKSHFYSWIYAMVRNAKYKAHAESNAHGSAQANVSGKLLMEYEVCFPGDNVVSLFHEKVSSLIELILRNHHQSECLGETRDLLLPKLLSGEISVGVAEAKLEETV